MTHAVGQPIVRPAFATRFADLRVTGSGICDFDQRLTGLEWWDIDLRQNEGRAEFDEQGGGGFHVNDQSCETGRGFRKR